MCEYLVLLFYEVGICSQSMNGATTLTWTEIDAWIRATGRRLTHWEVTTIRAMSKAYVEEYHAACSEKLRPIPFTDKTEEAKIKQEVQLENFFEMMMEKE